jgi:hypothetical protein
MRWDLKGNIPWYRFKLPPALAGGVGGKKKESALAEALG